MAQDERGHPRNMRRLAFGLTKNGWRISILSFQVAPQGVSVALVGFAVSGQSKLTPDKFPFGLFSAALN
jgi:hypothetical protein